MKRFYFDSWPRKNKWPGVYFTMKGIAKERQGWRVCYLQRYLQDALNSHQIVLSKVTSCSSSQDTLKVLYSFIYYFIHVQNGLFCQIVYKPIHYSFLKVDLDELLVRRVAELVGFQVTTLKLSCNCRLQRPCVRMPISFPSCRLNDFCYTSSSVSCFKKV